MNKVQVMDGNKSDNCYKKRPPMAAAPFIHMEDHILPGKILCQYNQGSILLLSWYMLHLSLL